MDVRARDEQVDGEVTTAVENISRGCPEQQIDGEVTTAAENTSRSGPEQQVDGEVTTVAANTSRGCPEQQACMEVQHINNKFPHEVLVKLFSNLPRDDIVTVQRVCHNWRAAAQDIYLWDSYTLMLCGKPDDEKNIKIMPALRNINGHAENHIVDVILENTMQLNKLNCIFHSRISASQVQSVMEKYPKLESITLHLRAPDVLESVEVLKRSEHLKELLFCKLRHLYKVQWEQNPSTTLFLQIFNLFADGNNFPALKRLDLLDLYFAAYDQFKAIVADIILKRSQQLQSLKLKIGITDNAEILNSVWMCTNLEELYLQLNAADQLVNFNLDRMSKLKSLVLSLFVRNNDCVSPVCESFNRSTWEHLKQVQFTTGTTVQFKEGILTAIIQNAKQLRSLTYKDMGYQTSEQELKHVGSLTELEKVDITGLQSITKDGITFLAGCHNLNYIRLYVHTADTDGLCADIAVVVRPMKKLGYFSFYNTVSALTFASREEIQNFISETLSS